MFEKSILFLPKMFVKLIFAGELSITRSHRAEPVTVVASSVSVVASFMLDCWPGC